MGYPLRVLHVIVNMNRGGAETLLMNLYRNIDRMKVQFDFLTCKEGVFDSEIKSMGGMVHRIPYLTEVGHSGYIKALDKFFKEHPEYKIVHSHLDKMSGFVLRAAKRAEVPIRIAHSHNTQSEGGVAAKTYKWIAGRYIKPAATHFYACSDTAANWLYGSKTKNVTLLKNGIECDKFSYSEDIRNQMRRELQLHSDTLVVGHVGRFFHQKNHSFLLEVFAEVHKKIPDSVLLLIGDGDLRAKIEDKIQIHHLEGKVRLLGVRDDIHHLLQAFDFFVFPSLHEGLPVTLIEAQGAGLPCIISEKITKEVDMNLGLVHSLSLSNVNRWVDQITELHRKSYTRNKPVVSLATKGYDIRKTAQVTQNSYLALGGS